MDYCITQRKGETQMIQTQDLQLLYNTMVDIEI